MAGARKCHHFHGKILSLLAARIPTQKPSSFRRCLQFAFDEKNQFSNFLLQVELLDDEEVSSKSVAEVDEKARGDRGGEGGGGGEVEGVITRERGSGVGEACEGPMAAMTEPKDRH